MLLLVFMTTVWSIQGAHWVDGTEILAGAGLLGFLVGFGLAKTRFVPGLLAHSFMLSVGMVVVGILILPHIDDTENEWWSKLGLAVRRVVKWSNGVFSGRATEDPLVGLVGLGLLVWALGYSTSWLLFRRQRVWGAITLVGTILIVNLAYNPPGALISFLVFLVGSLLLVVRFQVYQNEERWRKLRLYFRPGMLRWALGIGGSVAFIAVAIAFTAPNGGTFTPLQSFVQQITTPWQSFQGSITSIFTGQNSGKDLKIGRLPAGYNSFNKSFTIGGPIKLSNDPVLQVRGTDVSYLQAAVMDEYDGKGWIATYQDGGDKKSDLVFPQLSLSAGQSLPSSPYINRKENSLEVTPLQPGSPAMFSSGETISANRNSLLAFHWEKVTIRANLTEIKPLDIGSALDGKARVALVDTTNNNKPIAPDLLPLVRLLREAANSDIIENMPTFIAINYDNLNGWKVAWRANATPPSSRVLSGNAAANLDGTYKIELDDWVFTLPSIQQLDNLKLSTTSQSSVNTRDTLRVKFSRKSNSSVTGVIAIDSVQGASNFSYVFALTPNNLVGKYQTQAQFEQSQVGKEIRNELDRLNTGNLGGKADYSFENGRPKFFSYEGYQPNYDDLMAVTASQAPNTGETYRTNSLRYQGSVDFLKQVSATDRRPGTVYIVNPTGQPVNPNVRINVPRGQLQAGPVLYNADTQTFTTLSTPDWVKSRYLQLPSTIPQRVKDLATSLTKDARNDYDKAKAIETYLRTLKYNENTDFTPPDRDVVDYFLFDSKQGYCIHFATAFDVMMRSIGVPSRFVTGFIGGEYDQTTSSYIVRGTAAHAWPQVYFAGAGWVNFEPTPAYSSSLQPANQSSVAPLPTPTPDTNSASDPGKVPTPKDETPDELPVNSPAGSITPQNGFNFPVWLGLMLGIIVAGIATWQGGVWWRKAQYNLPDVSPRVVYARVQQTARKAGLDTRKSMTPYEYSKYLSRQLPKAGSQVEAITSAYVQDRYSAEGTAPPESLPQLRRYWEEFVSSVLEYRKERTLERLTPKFLRRKKPEIKSEEQEEEFKG